MNGARQWDTTTEIIAWLESPAGEQWSRANHHRPGIGLVTLKDDTSPILYGVWLA